MYHVKILKKIQNNGNLDTYSDRVYVGVFCKKMIKAIYEERQMINTGRSRP
jgi:hypothetical protein